MAYVTSKPSHKIPALDCLRGVAILAVLGYHILGASFYHFGLPSVGLWPDWSAAPSRSFLIFYPLSLGWAGVQLFFVISGFVIHLSYLGRPESHSVSRFYHRRFWRIVPPYWASLIAFVLLGLWTAPFSIMDIVLHTALCHDFSARYFFTINPSYWSLAVEFHIYLLYPLLLPLGRRVALLAVFGVICLATQFAVGRWLVAGDLQNLIANSLLVNLSHWWLGVVIAERYIEGTRIFPSWSVWPLIIVAALSSQCSLTGLYSSSFIAVACAALVEWAIYNPAIASRRLGRALGFVGVISYSLYLWHQPILHSIKPLLPDHPIWQMVLQGFVITPILIVLSWASYRWIEQPSERLGKRILSRKQA